MRQTGPLRRGGLYLITPMDQEVAHMGAVGGAQLQRHYASRLQPWPGKALGHCLDLAIVLHTMRRNTLTSLYDHDNYSIE
jgi:hypothetical protein